MKLVITGATGYIGARLMNRALASGHSVVAVCRNRPKIAGVEWFAFDLRDENDINIPHDTDAVIHLAANTSAGQGDVDELRAANRLLHASSRACNSKSPIKFIFISSQTAKADAPTAYGRSKWQIEQAVLKANGIVVRPGLVYGGACRGLFGQLSQIVSKSIFLPALLPAPLVQPIHVDDLANGLILVAAKGVNANIYCLAGSPIRFSVFLNALARIRLNRVRLFMPVPTKILLFLRKLIGERLSDQLGLSRVCALIKLETMPQSLADVALLGLNLRDVHSGLHKSGSEQNRRLLTEARVMFEYVASCRSSMLMRRYVRVIKKFRHSRSACMPRAVQLCPSLLCLFDVTDDMPSEMQTQLKWRLDAATLIAEASPVSIEKFIFQQSSHALLRPLIAIGGIVFALLRELVCRVVKFAYVPTLRFSDESAMQQQRKIN